MIIFPIKSDPSPLYFPLLLILQGILAELRGMESNSNKKRTNSDDIHSLEALKAETADVTETQKKIENSVIQQTAAMTKRVDEILDRVTQLKNQLVKK